MQIIIAPTKATDQGLNLSLQPMKITAGSLPDQNQRVERQEEM